MGSLHMKSLMPFSHKEPIFSPDALASGLLHGLASSHRIEAPVETPYLPVAESVTCQAGLHHAAFQSGTRKSYWDTARR